MEQRAVIKNSWGTGSMRDLSPHGGLLRIANPYIRIRRIKGDQFDKKRSPFPLEETTFPFQFSREFPAKVYLWPGY